MIEISWVERMVTGMREKNISRGQMADAVGVSQCALSLWISKSRSPSDISTYERIARKLGYTVEYLLFGAVCELSDMESRLIQVIRVHPAAREKVFEAAKFWLSQHKTTSGRRWSR